MGRQVQTVDWAQIEPKIQTGDLFLCHGSELSSEAIEWVTGSIFSHVGMFVRLGKNRVPYIWQEAPDPLLADPKHHNKAHRGAQLGAAETIVSIAPKYHEVTYWRPLVWDRPADFEDRLLGVIPTLDGVPFAKGDLGMVERWIAGKLDIALAPSSMFCAELIAQTLQRLDLLGRQPPANGYAPADFGGAPPAAKLRHGAALGELVHVVGGTVDITAAEAAERSEDPAAAPRPAAGTT